MANEFKESFYQILKSRRRGMGPGNISKSKKANNTVRLLYPGAQERQYYKYINQILGIFKREVSIIIINNLTNWIEEKQSTDRLDSSKIRLDSWIDEVNRFIIRMKSFITGDIFGDPEDPIEDSEIWQEIAAIAIAIYVFSQTQWGKLTKKILGIELQMDETWWGDVRRAWSSENYILMKNLSEEYINKINEIVYRGIRTNISVKDIKTEIVQLNQRMFGPRSDGKQSRAELIARDQVGKLNGLITKKRMQEAGLDIYEWLTSMDERVRGRPGGKYPNEIPDHWEMEGKLGKWNDNTVYAEKENRDEKGHLIWMKRTNIMPIAIPGQEIQCRCTGVAYIDDLLEEIDSEVEGV